VGDGGGGGGGGVAATQGDVTRHDERQQTTCAGTTAASGSGDRTRIMHGDQEAAGAAARAGQLARYKRQACCPKCGGEPWRRQVEASSQAHASHPWMGDGSLRHVHAVPMSVSGNHDGRESKRHKTSRKRHARRQCCPELFDSDTKGRSAAERSVETHTATGDKHEQTARRARHTRTVGSGMQSCKPRHKRSAAQ